MAIKKTTAVVLKMVAAKKVLRMPETMATTKEMADQKKEIKLQTVTKETVGRAVAMVKAVDLIAPDLMVAAKAVLLEMPDQMAERKLPVAPVVHPVLNKVDPMELRDLVVLVADPMVVVNVDRLLLAL